MHTYLYGLAAFSQNLGYELQSLVARVLLPETGIAEPLEDFVKERGLVLLFSPCL